MSKVIVSSAEKQVSPLLFELEYVGKRKCMVILHESPGTPVIEWLIP